MVPTVNIDMQNVTVEEEPSKTFRLSGNKMIGTCDNLEAVKQAIYLMLNIERYDHMIYSWNYGVEFKDLIGSDTAYAYPELKRRIEEALTQDDRIQSVDAFSFAQTMGIVTVSFTVHTIFGDVETESEVSI